MKKPFAAFLTPQEAYEKYGDLPPVPLATYIIRSFDNRRCSNCGDHVWRLASTGLCFPCTTGSLDASDDFEIGTPY